MVEEVNNRVTKQRWFVFLTQIILLQHLSEQVFAYKCQKIIKIGGQCHFDRINGFNIQQDNKNIISYSDDGHIILWDYENLNVINDFADHKSKVIHTSISSSNQLYTVDITGYLIVYNVETGLIISKQNLSLREIDRKILFFDNFNKIIYFDKSLQKIFVRDIIVSQILYQSEIIQFISDDQSLVDIIEGVKDKVYIAVFMTRNIVKIDLQASVSTQRVKILTLSQTVNACLQMKIIQSSNFFIMTSTKQLINYNFVKEQQDYVQNFPSNLVLIDLNYFEEIDSFVGISNTSVHSFDPSDISKVKRTYLIKYQQLYIRSDSITLLSMKLMTNLKQVIVSTLNGLFVFVNFETEAIEFVLSNTGFNIDAFIFDSNNLFFTLSEIKEGIQIYSFSQKRIIGELRCFQQPYDKTVYSPQYYFSTQYKKYTITNFLIVQSFNQADDTILNQNRILENRQEAISSYIKAEGFVSEKYNIIIQIDAYYINIFGYWRLNVINSIYRGLNSKLPWTYFLNEEDNVLYIIFLWCSSKQNFYQQNILISFKNQQIILLWLQILLKWIHFSQIHRKQFINYIYEYEKIMYILNIKLINKNRYLNILNYDPKEKIFSVVDEDNTYINYSIDLKTQKLVEIGSFYDFMFVFFTLEYSVDFVNQKVFCILTDFDSFSLYTNSYPEFGEFKQIFASYKISYFDMIPSIKRLVVWSVYIPAFFLLDYEGNILLSDSTISISQELILLFSSPYLIGYSEKTILVINMTTNTLQFNSYDSNIVQIIENKSNFIAHLVTGETFHLNLSSLKSSTSLQFKVPSYSFIVDNIRDKYYYLNPTTYLTSKEVQTSLLKNDILIEKQIMNATAQNGIYPNVDIATGDFPMFLYIEKWQVLIIAFQMNLFEADINTYTINSQPISCNFSKSINYQLYFYASLDLIIAHTISELCTVQISRNPNNLSQLLYTMKNFIKFENNNINILQIDQAYENIVVSILSEDYINTLLIYSLSDFTELAKIILKQNPNFIHINPNSSILIFGRNEIYVFETTSFSLSYRSQSKKLPKSSQKHGDLYFSLLTNSGQVQFYLASNTQPIYELQTEYSQVVGYNYNFEKQELIVCSILPNRCTMRQFDFLQSIDKTLYIIEICKSDYFKVVENLDIIVILCRTSIVGNKNVLIFKKSTGEMVDSIDTYNTMRFAQYIQSHSSLIFYNLDKTKRIMDKFYQLNLSRYGNMGQVNSNNYRNSFFQRQLHDQTGQVVYYGTNAGSVYIFDIAKQSLKLFYRGINNVISIQSIRTIKNSYIFFHTTQLIIIGQKNTFEISKSFAIQNNQVIITGETLESGAIPTNDNIDTCIFILYQPSDIKLIKIEQQVSSDVLNDKIIFKFTEDKTLKFVDKSIQKIQLLEMKTFGTDQPSQRVLIAISFNGQITFIDCNKLIVLNSLNDLHTETINQIKFIKSQNLLITSSLDGHLRVTQISRSLSNPSIIDFVKLLNIEPVSNSSFNQIIGIKVVESMGNILVSWSQQKQIQMISYSSLLPSDGSLATKENQTAVIVRQFTIPFYRQNYQVKVDEQWKYALVFCEFVYVIFSLYDGSILFISSQSYIDNFITDVIIVSKSILFITTQNTMQLTKVNFDDYQKFQETNNKDLLFITEDQILQNVVIFKQDENSSIFTIQIVGVQSKQFAYYSYTLGNQITQCSVDIINPSYFYLRNIFNQLQYLNTLSSTQITSFDFNIYYYIPKSTDSSAIDKVQNFDYSLYKLQSTTHLPNFKYQDSSKIILQGIMKNDESVTSDHTFLFDVESAFYLNNALFKEFKFKDLEFRHMKIVMSSSSLVIISPAILSIFNSLKFYDCSFHISQSSFAQSSEEKRFLSEFSNMQIIESSSKHVSISPSALSIFSSLNYQDCSFHKRQSNFVQSSAENRFLSSQTDKEEIFYQFIIDNVEIVSFVSSKIESIEILNRNLFMIQHFKEFQMDTCTYNGNTFEQGKLFTLFKGVLTFLKNISVTKNHFKKNSNFLTFDQIENVNFSKITVNINKSTISEKSEPLINLFCIKSVIFDQFFFSENNEISMIYATKYSSSEKEDLTYIVSNNKMGIIIKGSEITKNAILSSAIISANIVNFIEFNDLSANENTIQGHALIQLDQLNSIKILNSNFKENSSISFIKVNNANYCLVKESIFKSNISTLNGGALSFLYSRSESTLQDENTTSEQRTKVLIDLSYFEENIAQSYGGAVYFKNVDWIIQNSKFISNVAVIGGAISYKDYSPTFLNSQVSQTEFEIKYKNTFTTNTGIFFGKNRGSYPMYASKSSKEITKNFKIENFRSGETIQDYQIFIFDEEKNIIDPLFDLKKNEKYLKTFKTSQTPKNIQDEMDLYVAEVSSESDKAIMLQDIFRFYFNSKIVNTTLSIQGLKILGDPSKSSHFSLSTPFIKIPSTKNGEFISINPLQINIDFRECIIGEVYTKVIENIYECTPCNNNKFSLITPVRDVQQQCQVCPLDKVSSCEGNELTLKTGYWRESQMADLIIPCSNKPENCNGDPKKGYCAEGYFGPQCQTCDSYGEVWNKRYGIVAQYTCRACDEYFIFFISAYFLYSIKKTLDKAQKFVICQTLRRMEWIIIGRSGDTDQVSLYMKMLINFIQITSVAQLNHYSALNNFQNYFNIIGSPSVATSLSFDCLLGSQKYFPIEYLRAFTFSTIPLVYVICALFIYVAMAKLSRGAQVNIKFFYASFTFSLVFFQSGVTGALVSLFSCKQIGNTYFIHAQMNKECYTDEHRKYIYFFIIPLIFIWVIAYPALIFWRICIKKKFLTEPIQIYKYGFIYNDFKLKYYYWEFIRILVRISIIFIGSVFVETQQYLIFGFCVIILIIYIYFLQKIQPFSVVKFNKYDVYYNHLIIIIFLCYLFFSYSETAFFKSLFFFAQILFLISGYMQIIANILVCSIEQNQKLKDRLTNCFPILKNSFTKSPVHQLKRFILWKKLRVNFKVFLKEKEDIKFILSQIGSDQEDLSHSECMFRRKSVYSQYIKNQSISESIFDLKSNFKIDAIIDDED